MKVALLGRSELLLNAAKKIQSNGHEIVLIGTAKSESYYESQEIDFENYANLNKIPFFCSQTLNTSAILEKLNNSNAEIGISVNWPNLIGQEACCLFQHGILNAHAGDLPRYRGNACPNWAILNSEEKIALSIHQIDPHGLDTGDIILKKYFPLNSGIYIEDVYAWLRDIIPSAFCEAIDAIKNNASVSVPQSLDTSESLRCYPRRPEDGKINWEDKARDIHALIRASSHPFAGAFCFMENGEKIIIWKAELMEDEPPFCAVPGQIMYRDNGYSVIACGVGAIKILDASTENTLDKSIIMKLLIKSVRSRLS